MKVCTCHDLCFIHIYNHTQTHNRLVNQQQSRSSWYMPQPQPLIYPSDTPTDDGKQRLKMFISTLTNIYSLCCISSFTLNESNTDMSIMSLKANRVGKFNSSCQRSFLELSQFLHCSLLFFHCFSTCARRDWPLQMSVLQHHSKNAVLRLKVVEHLKNTSL